MDIASLIKRVETTHNKYLEEKENWKNIQEGWNALQEGYIHDLDESKKTLEELSTKIKNLEEIIKTKDEIISELEEKIQENPADIIAEEEAKDPVVKEVIENKPMKVTIKTNGGAEETVEIKQKVKKLLVKPAERELQEMIGDKK